MKLYLAGPMRGFYRWNVDAFDAAAADLRAQGHEVFNPCDRDRALGCTFDEDVDPETKLPVGFDLGGALIDDLTYIAKEADAIALLPNWESSKGVAVELALAKAMNKPVLQLYREPTAWQWGIADW